MKNMTIQEIKEHLVNNGMKASLPRVKIYEYLITYKSHPTVDEIFNSLNEELLTLSKTTVYNTLNLLVENNLAIQILIEDNEVRYDADVSNHGHFKCLKCEKVYDFNYNMPEHLIDDIEGFIPEEYHLYIKGICKTCKGKVH